MINDLDNPSIDRPSASGTTDNYKKIKSAKITNIATADDNVNFFEPSSPEASEQAKNTITVTYSGHVIEIDDTDGAERICIFHKSGHFVELTTEHRVTKIYGKDYKFILDDSNEYVSGTKNLTVEGDVNLLVKGNCTQKIEGDFTQKVNGDYNVFVKGKYNILNENDMQIESKSNLILKSGELSRFYSKSAFYIDAAGDIRINEPLKEPPSLKLNFGVQLSTSLSEPSASDQYLNRTQNPSMFTVRDTTLTYPKDRTR